MSDRLKTISRLIGEDSYRRIYLKSKLNVLIPAQLRALRKQQDLTQADLALAADMKQSRISTIERPGATNFNLETLVRLASAMKVGIKVEFVPFSEVLRWDNSFSQDEFRVATIDQDSEFLEPGKIVSSINFNPEAQFTGIFTNVNDYGSTVEFSSDDFVWGTSATVSLNDMILSTPTPIIREDVPHVEATAA